MNQSDIKEVLQWDVKSWSKALYYWEKSTNWKNVNTALELGGREGGLSLWLAKKGIKVTCSDLKNVRSTAEPLHIKHGVTELISYEDIDASNIPYENHFDVIVFKSIIGGIGSNDNLAIQKKVFKEIHKALKPGGHLLFAENLSSSPLHQFMRKRFVSWGSRWRYVSLDEMKEFLSDFSSYEIETNGFSATFGRSAGQRNLLARLDKAIFEPLTPNSWRYIAYGVAKK